MEFTFPIPPTAEDMNVEILPHSKSEDAVSDAVEQYFQAYSPQTVKAYKADLQTWWSFSHKGARDTTPQDVLGYIKHLEDQGYQNASINRKIASLSKIFNIYISMGLATANPVQILSTTTRIYKPISPEVSNVLTLHDVEKVIQGARKHTSILVKFLANTGVRVSEMINITKEDLEPKSHEYMSVRIRRAKGGKNRYIYISYALYAEIKDVFDGDSLYLFASKSGNPLSRINVYKQISRAFKRYADVSASPHSLRHFFATRKISVEKKDIKAVSTYLGHSDPALTLRVYVSNQLQPEETEII